MKAREIVDEMIRLWENEVAVSQREKIILPYWVYHAFYYELNNGAPLGDWIKINSLKYCGHEIVCEE